MNKQVWYKSPWLIGWIFLVLTAMAGTINMVIQANKGFPGLVVDDFYERGQDYEENIIEKLKSNQRWKTAYKLSEIHVNSETTIKFSIVSKEGKSANIEKITLFSYRPSNAKKDFSTPMQKTTNENEYQAKLTFHIKGRWDLLASIIIDGVEVNYAKKIFVKD